jgi:hypothetical protein
MCLGMVNLQSEIVKNEKSSVVYFNCQLSSDC